MSTIDIDKFSQLVKSKRGNKNLRKTAEEIGEISISTLSRIEQGKIPDLKSYLKICKWLKVSPNEFMQQIDSVEMSHKEIIYFHLRADQSLDPDVSDALTKMIDLAYSKSKDLFQK
jgi:transcriptional regulator with XRE-family HTH domain